jgi:hypothetical protein
MDSVHNLMGTVNRANGQCQYAREVPTGGQGAHVPSCHAPFSNPYRIQQLERPETIGTQRALSSGLSFLQEVVYPMNPFKQSGIRVKALTRSSLLLTIAFATLSPLCLAQILGQAKAGEQPVSIDSSIEVARADIRADKNAMISSGMNFSEKEGAAFWPVYRKYEYERSTVEDLRATVIKEYAKKYTSITDADAKTMADRFFECDARDIELRKKYFKEFNKVLPAITVAKFFQLEHRIDLLIGMKVESSLPALGDQQNVANPQQVGDTQQVGQPN